MASLSLDLMIQTLDAVYSFRKKVYNVVRLVANDPLMASQMSSGLSSYIRKYLEDVASEMRLHININLSDSETLMRFSMPVVPYSTQVLNSCFDKVNTQEGNSVVATKSFNGLRDQEINMNIIQEELTRKSKEELMNELIEQERALRLSMEALEKTTVEKINMQKELNVAKDIQLSMLPVDFPAFPEREDMDVHAALIPAKAVGGDFYDFYFLDSVNLGLVVGDVSGKGVPAALMMAVCKTLLKSRASADKSTASILTHVNNEMAKDNKNFMFVTVFMGILNMSTGMLTYSNAGHNPTYIRKKDGELVKLSELHGPVIAAMEQMSYRESKIQLEKGDMIFGYTDGVVESHNKDGELYTDERLANLLEDANGLNCKDIVEQVMASVHEFEKGMEQFDDITTMCIEYKGMENTNAVLEKKLVLKNTLEEVQNAMAEFETFAELHSISFPIIMKINIVIDEILSNIVKYGFPKEEENQHNVEMDIELHTRKLIITFRDGGVPFNPFQKTPPNMDLPIEQREIGGLGIHLVRKLMDEYSYTRAVNTNIVTMVKNEV